MATPRFSFDAGLFALIVHAKRFLRGEKMDGFAEAMGVSRDTIYRAERKRQISMLSFLTLCHGLGAHPMTFFLADGKRVGPETSDVSQQVSRETPVPKMLQGRNAVGGAG